MDSQVIDRVGVLETLIAIKAAADELNRRAGAGEDVGPACLALEEALEDIVPETQAEKLAWLDAINELQGDSYRRMARAAAGEDPFTVPGIARYPSRG